MKNSETHSAVAAPMFVLALLGAAVAAILDPAPDPRSPPTVHLLLNKSVPDARMVDNQHRNDRAMVI